MNDVGLLRRMANLDSKIVVEGNTLFLIEYMDRFL